MEMMQKESQESIVHIYPWISGEPSEAAPGRRSLRAYAREDIGRDQSAETSVGRHREDVPCHLQHTKLNLKVDKKLKPNGKKCDEDQRTPSIGQVTSLLP